MHRFYAPDIAATLTLPDEESAHAVRVLRMVAGDALEVVDGKGNLYTCRISEAHSKHCQVAIDTKATPAQGWPGSLTIAIAPTKNMDRMEWMAEKCTELGIDRITPLLCRNSERKVLKTERLQKKMVSAMKQSLKAKLPQLDELTPALSFIAQPFHGKRFIAYCDETLPRNQRKLLPQELIAGADAQVLIGPEGDFSHDEVQAALAAGFVPVSLGNSRLRTETAAVAACEMFHCVNMLYYNDKN